MSLQVKAIIAANKGDLSAAEAALAEQGRNADDDDNLDDDVIESSPPPGMPKGKGAKRSACASGEEKALRSLQQRISESGATLEAMRSATLQPVTSRTTFANYVRDSLLSMSDQNFKRARKEMNRFLTSLMDEDDDHSDEAVPSMQPYVTSQPQMTSGIFTKPTPPSNSSQYASSDSSRTTSPCDLYQPPPNYWRKPPAGPHVSPWQSQDQEYMSVYMQQPLLSQQKQQQQQQHTPQNIPGAHQWSSMPPPAHIGAVPVSVTVPSASPALISSISTTPGYAVLSQYPQVNHNGESAAGGDRSVESSADAAIQDD
ncbi:MAG: hypothetical protein ABW185_21955 [Sedimenticola sp.]